MVWKGRKVNASQGQPTPGRGGRSAVDGMLAQGQECQSGPRSSAPRASGYWPTRSWNGPSPITRKPSASTQRIRRPTCFAHRAFEEKGDDEQAEADLTKAQQVNTGDG